MLLQGKCRKQYFLNKTLLKEFHFVFYFRQINLLLFEGYFGISLYETFVSLNQ